MRASDCVSECEREMDKEVQTLTDRVCGELYILLNASISVIFFFAA
jgi:hypothetical protein